MPSSPSSPAPAPTTFRTPTDAVICLHAAKQTEPNN